MKIKLFLLTLFILTCPLGLLSVTDEAKAQEQEIPFMNDVNILVNENSSVEDVFKQMQSRNAKCIEQLKKEGAYSEDMLIPDCRKFRTTRRYKENAEDEYEVIVQQCLLDMQKPGSIQDKMKEKPGGTGLTQFSEEHLQKILEEFEKPLKMHAIMLTVEEYGEEKFLKISLNPDTSSFTGGEDWSIIYRYDLTNRVFIGKSFFVSHGDWG